MRELEKTGQFSKSIKMPRVYFDYFLQELQEDLTLSVKQSRNSTSGNDPIYQEIILACGMCFLAGDSVRILSQLYGMSPNLCRRIINICLNSIDHNHNCAELQVKLPTNKELPAITQKWNKLSTSYGLFNGHMGGLDGWLPRTKNPLGVSNQSDYYSGHYQCFGLNVQALCGPDLEFFYLAVAAPGKTNDIRAFGRCRGLIDRFNGLPDEYFISADNAYNLSRKVLIPFSGADIDFGSNRDYNFYLSQLRIRIEMVCGMLTTTWRRLQMGLNYSNRKNSQIVQVCSKLHNFCICTNQLGTIGVVDEESFVPADHNIDSLTGAGNSNANAAGVRGLLATSPLDDPMDVCVLDSSRRDAIVAKLASAGIKPLQHNLARNG